MARLLLVLPPAVEAEHAEQAARHGHEVVGRPPGAAEAAAQVLSLPVYPSLSQDELDTIVEAVNAVAKAGS